MKNKLHLITLTALALAGPFSAQAKSKKSEAGASVAATSPAEKGERPLPYLGKIGTVDASAKTFAIMPKDGKERVFTVTDKSVLTKGGKPATFTDIVKDEEVRGSYWKKGETMEAKTVKLGPLTAEEQAAKAAKAAKKAAQKSAIAMPSPSVAVPSPSAAQ